MLLKIMLLNHSNSGKEIIFNYLFYYYEKYYYYQYLLPILIQVIKTIVIT